MEGDPSLFWVNGRVENVNPPGMEGQKGGISLHDTILKRKKGEITMEGHYGTTETNLIIDR